MSNKEGRILFMVWGLSGVGKDTLVNRYCDENPEYSIVKSLTTRKRRYLGEDTHEFVTEDEFKAQGEMIAETYYNGNHYGASKKQLDEGDFYIVDKRGIQDVIRKYKTDRKLVVIYVYAPIFIRLHRLIRRDGLLSGIKRFMYDSIFQSLATLRGVQEFDVVTVRSANDPYESYMQFKATILASYLANKDRVDIR